MSSKQKNTMAEKPSHGGSNPASAAASSTSDKIQLDTSKGDRHVWLMKCPPVVARAMQNNHRDPFSDAEAGPVVGKVTVSIDPLLPNDDSSTQVYDCTYTLDLYLCADVSRPVSVSPFWFYRLWFLSVFFFFVFVDLHAPIIIIIILGLGCDFACMDFLFNCYNFGNVISGS